VVACPAAGLERAQRLLYSTGTCTPVLGDYAPIWKIDDREEFELLRSNPQLLRIGLVTDPWTWYANVFVKARGEGAQAAVAARTWGRGSLSFKDFIRGVTSPEQVLGAGRCDPRAAPKPMGVAWDPDDTGGWAGILAATGGLCSYSFLYHYGTKSDWQQPQQRPEWGVDLLLDSHRMEPTLGRMLNITPTATARRVPSRGGNGKTRSVSYDEQMVNWVRAADAPLIDLMQYEEPGRPGRGDPLLPVRGLGARRTGPGPKGSAEDRFTIGKTRHRRRIAAQERLKRRR